MTWSHTRFRSRETRSTNYTGHIESLFFLERELDSVLFTKPEDNGFIISYVSRASSSCIIKCVKEKREEEI